MNIIKIILEAPVKLFVWLQKLITPKTLFSAQTMLVMGGFSFAIAFLATGWVQKFISICGWLLIIFGYTWQLNENPVRITGLLLNYFPQGILLNYWLMGGLICLFIFGGIFNQWFDSGLWVALPIIVILITITFEVDISLQINPRENRSIISRGLMVIALFIFIIVAQDQLALFNRLNDFFDQLFIFGWLLFTAAFILQIWQTSSQVGNLPLLSLITILALVGLFGVAVFLGRQQQLNLLMIPIGVFLMEFKLGFQGSKLPDVPVRQKLVILLGIHLLFSCWLQFQFVINNLLEDYPRLIREDFSNSAFVVKMPWAREVDRSEIILSFIADQTTAKLNQIIWPETERLLQSPLLQVWVQDLLVTWQVQQQQNQQQKKEDLLWRTIATTTPQSQGHLLDIGIIWDGPRLNTPAYKSIRTCQITRIDRPASAATAPLGSRGRTQPNPVTKVECLPETRRILIRP
jgi:hypothetical protein